MLPLYSRVWADDTLNVLVKRELVTLKEAMAHSEIPFDHIVDTCQMARSPAHNPLVQVMITTEEKGEQRRAWGCAGELQCWVSASIPAQLQPLVRPYGGLPCFPVIPGVINAIWQWLAAFPAP